MTLSERSVTDPRLSCLKPANECVNSLLSVFVGSLGKQTRVTLEERQRFRQPLPYAKLTWRLSGLATRPLERDEILVSHDPLHSVSSVSQLRTSKSLICAKLRTRR